MGRPKGMGTGKLKPGATSITWVIGKSAYECVVYPHACQFCGVRAIIALPAPLLAKETDGTTHVCHPGFGGCNHGFAVAASAVG